MFVENGFLQSKMIDVACWERLSARRKGKGGEDTETRKAIWWEIGYTWWKRRSPA